MSEPHRWLYNGEMQPTNPVRYVRVCLRCSAWGYKSHDIKAIPEFEPRAFVERMRELEPRSEFWHRTPEQDRLIARLWRGPSLKEIRARARAPRRRGASEDQRTEGRNDDDDL